MKPARFWPLATIILLPVLVLAGVAVSGLKDFRQRQQDKARAEGARFARRAAQAWEERLGHLHRTSVLLYPPVPVPGPATREAEALSSAVGAGDTAALRDLSEIAGRSPLTESGLPVRLLAAWHLWMLTGDERDRNFAARLALHEDACCLSPSILVRIDKAESRGGDSSHKRWHAWRDLEERRALAAGMPEGQARAIRHDGKTRRAWLVRNAFDDGVSVTMHDELAYAWEQTCWGLHDENPGWASLELMADGVPFSDSRGPPAPGQLDYGMAQAGELFLVRVYPISYPWNWEYDRAKVWTGTIAGASLFSALLGLWLVRRTLNKERRLGELKSQFVSSVSHELRAPIGSMRLMAEGLASGRVHGEAAAEFHRLMAGEGARLSALIENVLDFARIEQGRKEYVMAETDVAALLTDAVALMQPQAEAKGLRILLECEPLPFVPRVDAAALQQAVINLLDNAVKFTAGQPDGPPYPDAQDSRAIRVTLAPGPSPQQWSLAVTDPGIGIPAAEHGRIFERFYRLGNELRRETTGTGIGLAIVKHIVEGHGGKVSVSSEPGRGSVFRMEFSVRSFQFSVRAGGSDAVCDSVNEGNAGTNGAEPLKTEPKTGELIP